MSETTTTTTKLFRAERTTKNYDDFKVLMVGALMTIIILLAIPVVGPAYIMTFSKRPFLSATVDVVKVEGYEEPMILYDTDATIHVSAMWSVTIRDSLNNRVNTRRGANDYTYAIDEADLWSWTAFFDNGIHTVPEIPDHPFKVCVRYSSRSFTYQVPDTTPEICSRLYNPKRPNIYINPNNRNIVE